MKAAITLGIAACLVLAVLAFAVSGPAPGARNAANYVGSGGCKCHMQTVIWEQSLHAQAFAVLATPQAKAIAAKLKIDNPQKSGKCLKCHSTAYHFSERIQTGKIKPVEGVSCESCHGPGKAYAPNDIMKKRKSAIEAGLIYPATRSCELCHNDQSPTWKADRYTTKDGKQIGFDAEQAYEKIKHALVHRRR
jgi:hypothetical protein